MIPSTHNTKKSEWAWTQNSVAPSTTVHRAEIKNAISSRVSVDSNDSFWSMGNSQQPEISALSAASGSSRIQPDKWSVSSGDSTDTFTQFGEPSSAVHGEAIIADSGPSVDDTDKPEHSPELPSLGEPDQFDGTVVESDLVVNENKSTGNTKDEIVDNGNDTSLVLDLSPAHQETSAAQIVKVDMQDANDCNSARGQITTAVVGGTLMLYRYYDMMYYFGICSYKTLRQNKAENRLCSAFQNVVFWSLAILSEMESIAQIKFQYLKLISNQDYSTYVAFAFHLACMLAKMYAVYLFVAKKDKTNEMLEIMNAYERSCTDSEGNTTRKSAYKSNLTVLLAISTLMFALFKAILVSDTGSINELLLEGSHELSRDIFVWTSNETQNTTERLQAEYGETLTVTTISMGFVVFLRDTANYLQIGMLFDLVILVDFAMYGYVMPFMKDIRKVAENVPKEHVLKWNELQAKRELVWERYRMLRSVFAAVNEIFDPLFKLLHVRNLMTYAFFMVTIIFGSNPWTAFGIYAVNLIKAEISYVVAGMIAAQNDAIREWIQNWGLHTGKIKVKSEEMDAGIILSELEKQPVGLGKGKFLIHQTFHYKFAGLVWSIFFSMANDETSN